MKTESDLCSNQRHSTKRDTLSGLCITDGCSQISLHTEGGKETKKGEPLSKALFFFPHQGESTETPPEALHRRQNTYPASTLKHLYTAVLKAGS